MQINKCAIYTRVSTDSQAEKDYNSCEFQEEKIKSFIESQEKFEIYKIYSDLGFTGANLDRPALKEMFNDIIKGKIDIILSYKIGRLTRSPKDFYQLVELLDKYNVHFISITERFDTSTPSGRLLRNIMLTFAQFERELISERVHDKMMERANKGFWNGGSLPYGYQNINKKLVLNPQESKIVRKIYDVYLSSGLTAEVYFYLKARDIKNRNGNNFLRCHINSILRNPVYIGVNRYKGKLYKGIHEPIIKEEVFNEAQKLHKHGFKKSGLYKNHILSGLVKCGECGYNMTPSYVIKKSKGKSTKYYYYKCTSLSKSDWNACSTRMVNAQRLENLIVKTMKETAHQDQYIDSLIFKRNFEYTEKLQGGKPDEIIRFYDSELFQRRLQAFERDISQARGLEQNLVIKKYIHRIEYNKDKILVALYYTDDKVGDIEGLRCRAEDQPESAGDGAAALGGQSNSAVNDLEKWFVNDDMVPHLELSNCCLL